MKNSTIRKWTAVTLVAMVISIPSTSNASAEAPIPAPAPRVAGALEIRGLMPLLRTTERIAGPNCLQPGQLQGMLMVTLGEMLGMDVISALNPNAPQRLVLFTQNGQLGAVLEIAPAEGDLPAMFAMLETAGWTPIPQPIEPEADMLPGTRVYTPPAQLAENGRVYFIPRGPNRVVVMPSLLCANLRPANLPNLLRNVPGRLPVEGLIALWWADMSLLDMNGALSNLIPDDAQQQQLQEALRQCQDYRSLAMGLGVSNGALVMDLQVQARPGTEIAAQMANMAEPPSAHASSVILPDAILAFACRGELMANMDAMPELRTLMNRWTAFFGPQKICDTALAWMPPSNGRTCPVAAYLQMDAPAARRAAFAEEMPRLPRLLLDTLEAISEEDLLPDDEEIPIALEAAGSRTLGNVEVDRWNVVLTDAPMDAEAQTDAASAELPRTLCTLDTAWVEDGVVFTTLADADLERVLQAYAAGTGTPVQSLPAFQTALPGIPPNASTVMMIRMGPWTRIILEGILPFVDDMEDEEAIRSMLAFLPANDFPLSVASWLTAPLTVQAQLGISLRDLQALIHLAQ